MSLANQSQVAGKPLPTVLAIDDSPEVITMIRGALGNHFKLLAARDGECGLAIALKTPPDLILLDVMMPDLDGFEVCRRLKANPRTEHIPVIFVTGLGGECDELQALQLGAVDFVTKPIEPVILQARVRSQVELARARGQLRRINSQLAEERELIASIITRMRDVQAFCDRNLSFATHSGDNASGDLVFSACRPDGAQHVLLGDFTGHGLPAAVGTPLMSYLFYSLTAQNRDMPEILQTINDVLVNQLPVNIFMVAIALCIPPDGGPVKLWSFGAPDVLHRDAQGSWHALDSQELPMGILAHQQPYAFRTLELPSDESLYLMTDGAIETMCSDGEMYGTRRLMASIDRFDESVQAVVEDVLVRASDEFELDDTTLLRIKRDLLPEAERGAA